MFWTSSTAWWKLAPRHLNLNGQNGKSGSRGTSEGFRCNICVSKEYLGSCKVDDICMQIQYSENDSKLSLPVPVSSFGI